MPGVPASVIRALRAAGDLVGDQDGGVLLVMLVVSEHGLGDREVTEKAAGHTGVFARDQVALRDGFARARGDVAEVAQGRGDNPEAPRRSGALASRA
jgi:hypothetical protein